MTTLESGYRLVFDATQKYGDRLSFALAFIIAVVGACIVAAIFVRDAVRRGQHRRVLSALALGAILTVLLAAVGGSLAVVTQVASTYVGVDDMTRAIDASAVVEGVVENFHPMPSGGHDSERFDVNGVHFEYGHWEVSQGFNQDVTVGGPIRSGLSVRIHYVTLGTPPLNVIVRLEVRD